MDEVEVAGRKVIVGTHGTMRVHIDLDVSSPYTAFVEVMSATNSVQEEAEKTDPEMPVVVEEKKLIIFDHHGPLSWKKSVSRQAFQWLLRPEGEEVGEIVVEPPLDSDLVLATLQLIQGRPAPKEVVEGVDLEDRKSAVALWHSIRQGRKELGAAVPILEAVNRVNKEFGGPWFSDTEEFAKALVEALGRVYKVIEDIKDGEIDPVKEGARWAEEFESWAERAIGQGEVVEELEIAGYRVAFAEDISPTALYVHGYDIAVSHGNGRVTVGLSPASQVTEQLDLRELFEFMNKEHREGWGGRDSVGGSPKDAQISRKEFESEVIPLIKEWLKRRLE